MKNRFIFVLLAYSSYGKGVIIQESFLRQASFKTITLFHDLHINSSASTKIQSQRMIELYNTIPSGKWLIEFPSCSDFEQITVILKSLKEYSQFNLVNHYIDTYNETQLLTKVATTLPHNETVACIDHRALFLAYFDFTLIITNHPIDKKIFKNVLSTQDFFEKFIDSLITILCTVHNLLELVKHSENKQWLIKLHQKTQKAITLAHKCQRDYKEYAQNSFFEAIWPRKQKNDKKFLSTALQELIKQYASYDMLLLSLDAEFLHEILTTSAEKHIFVIIGSKHAEHLIKTLQREHFFLQNKKGA